MCVLALVETVMLGVAQTRGTSTWFRAIGIIIISLCFFFVSDLRISAAEEGTPSQCPDRLETNSTCL